MALSLKHFFPIIQTRNKILSEIQNRPKLFSLFQSWTTTQQDEFLDFMTGAKGVKMLYDPFFKEIMNPEYTPERINRFLSLLLGENVRVVKVLPNDSTRLADEASLLITDIIVEMEDGSIANVECQKIGYHFPGQRSVCYSADLLLRQYKRIRSEHSKLQKKFSYREIKRVYTIILFQHSTPEFHAYSENYIHHIKYKSDTGLTLEMLQEFVFIPLDIFLIHLHNRGIRSELDAWLTFFSTDDPENIIKLCKSYPYFKKMYENIYELCQNIERVMEMFSKELLELDRNTVQYMIDEMQDELDIQKNTIKEQKELISKQTDTISAQKERV